VADDGAPFAAGVVLLPPSGNHLLVLPQDRTVLLATGPVPPARPSADLLPASLSVSCGPRAIAVVLSGGGHDGATGARGVRRRGGTLRVQEAAAAEVGPACAGGSKSGLSVSRSAEIQMSAINVGSVRAPHRITAAGQPSHRGIRARD